MIEIRKFFAESLKKTIRGDNEKKAPLTSAMASLIEGQTPKNENEANDFGLGEIMSKLPTEQAQHLQDYISNPYGPFIQLKVQVSNEVLQSIKKFAPELKNYPTEVLAAILNKTLAELTTELAMGIPDSIEYNKEQGK